MAERGNMSPSTGLGRPQMQTKGGEGDSPAVRAMRWRYPGSNKGGCR